MNNPLMLCTNEILQIIVIIASIDKYDIYKIVFSKFKKSSSLSFIIMGDFDSLTVQNLIKFLKKETKFEIYVIVDGLSLKTGAIYIKQIRKNILIQNGIFKILSTVSDEYVCIDTFLDSFTSYKNFNIVIVLLSQSDKRRVTIFKKIKEMGGHIITLDPRESFCRMDIGYINDGILEPENTAFCLQKYFLNEVITNMQQRRFDVETEKFLHKTQDQDLLQLFNNFTNYQVKLELQNDALIQAEVDLSKQRDKYRELYDLAPITYLTLSYKGMILEINRAGCDLFGIDKNYLINRSFSRYIDPNYQGVFLKHRKNVLNGKSSYSCELKLIRRKGSLFYAKMVSKAFINSESNKKEILTFIYDISDHKKTQDSLHQHQIRLAQMERLNSTNTLASILAHEINNPIAVITNYINGCTYRLKNNN